MSSPTVNRDPVYDLTLEKERQTFDEFTPFWDAYNNEAESYDKELIKEWANDLDALLIFAGLFAGSNTAFIIESYKKLQEDPAETNNLLLRNILHRLDNSTFTTEELKFTEFRASNKEIRINCFFFASLSFALFAAFGAVLAKQWLSQYEGGDSRVRLPSDRARMRHEKLRGLRRWYLRPVVETLPTLLQISLFLFLIGLVDFLWRLNTAVALVVLLISITIFIFYSSTTAISVFNPNAPFQTRFSGSLRRFLYGVLPPRRSPPNTKDLEEDDELREECVAWVLHSATLPSTIRTVCKAISVLPHAQVDKDEGLHDWNVVTRYLRTIISNAVVSVEVPKTQLPSALEVLYKLIIKSTSPQADRDYTLIVKELVGVLPGLLVDDHLSAEWVLRILGSIYPDDQNAFNGLVALLHHTITWSNVNIYGVGTGGIVDQLIILLERTLGSRGYLPKLGMLNLLDQVIPTGPLGFELQQEKDLDIFIKLLERPAGTIHRSGIFVDMVPHQRLQAPSLSVVSKLIRGILRHRVAALNKDDQTATGNLSSEVAPHSRFIGTLNLLLLLLKSYELSRADWEVELLVLFRSSFPHDLEVSAAILQILGTLASELSPEKFDKEDAADIIAFLRQPSVLERGDWLSSCLLTLFCACKRDGAVTTELLAASGIPESVMVGFFLQKGSELESIFESRARIELGSAWLLVQREAVHLSFMADGWSDRLAEYGSGGSGNTVYLKAMKDLLARPSGLWYDQLATGKHLSALNRIMHDPDDDKNGDWMGCFLFLAVWKWHWNRASEIGNSGSAASFLSEDYVETIVHFFTTPRGWIAKWNAAFFGFPFDDVMSPRDTVYAGRLYLQFAASKGLINKVNAPAVMDGYKRWARLFSDYLTDIGAVGFQSWEWAHDMDNNHFPAVERALNKYEERVPGDPPISLSPEHSGISFSTSLAHLSQSSVQRQTNSTTGSYVIRCIYSGSVLQCETGSTNVMKPLINHSDTNSLNQRWKRLLAAKCTYITYQKSSPQEPRLLQDGTKLVLGAGNPPNPPVALVCHSIPSEWELKRISDSDRIQIILHAYPDLAMDLPLDSTTNGVPFTIYESHGGRNQQEIG